MTNYVIDMAESAAVTVIANESRNLRALPFRPTEDQLTTGKAWEEWLEREFRYFRIGNPADRKDAMIIYGGKEIARLEKSLPDPVDASNEYEKLRKKLNDYFLPKSKQEKKTGCIYKNSKIKKTCESDTSDSSDDDFLSKSAAHMLRIKTLKSAPCVEKSATDVRFLKKEEVNFPGQQIQGMEAMIQMRDELHRHTQEIEMRLEQKLSEFIVQLSVLINTEALVFPCDKMSSMQMKDETDNDRCMQSNRNKMGVQSNNSQTQVENDRCISTNQTTNQTANLQSRIESNAESRKRDSNWEDSSFIDEGGCAMNYLTTRDKPTRRGRKKGKGKLHT